MDQLSQFLPLILMIGIFYFLMIRPQQKRVKKEREFESAIKVGDRIVTKSGIHGRIASINETTIVMETMAGKLLLEKSAISMEFSLKLKGDQKA